MTLRVIDHAAASDVGRVRRANEDSYFVRAPLFVVADGMGGAQAGEVASKIATEAFADGLDESLTPERRLVDVVTRANREIHHQSIADRSMRGMGTTLTAALLGDEDLTIAHVGDSRAYRLRDGELTRLTTDHSLVGEMVRRGAISEAEAEQHPQRSILTRALGPENEVEVDTVSYGVRDGDVYMLCSDGLTTMVDDALIAEIAGSDRPMRELAEQLIARANAAGGADNITVVAFKVAAGKRAGAGPATSPVTGNAQDDATDRTIDAPAQRPEDTPPVAPGAPGTAGSHAAPRRPETPAAAGNGHVDPRLIQPDSLARGRKRRGRGRLWLGVGFAALIFLLAGAGAVIGSLNVYFLGVDEHGLVTVYRGLPYEGSLGLQMYTRDYVSTTPASTLRPALRATLLDHTLRTRGDAIDLIRQVDRGNLTAIGSDAARDGASGASAAP
jgi:serine/threonine protein phosphatase PrpC